MSIKVDIIMLSLISVKLLHCLSKLSSFDLLSITRIVNIHESKAFVRGGKSYIMSQLAVRMLAYQMLAVLVMFQFS